MNLSKIFILLLLVLTFIFLSCKGPQGPVGPSSAAFTGCIVGTARLVSISGYLVQEAAGTRVEIEGTNITTTTDSTGLWILGGLKTGIHTINFTKPKYGLIKQVGYQFVGGDTVSFGTVYLWELPKFNVSNLVATSTPGYINVSANLIDTLPPSRRYVMILIGLTNTVSPNPADYLFTSLAYVDTPSTTITASITTQVLQPPIIPVGTTVYLVAYATAWAGSSTYIDFATGRRYFTELGLKPSNVDTTIIQ